MLAALGAVAAVVLVYARGQRTPTMTVSAALRALAVLFALALALDAPRGRAGERRPVIAIDASASWRRGRADSVWQRALATASAYGDTVWLAGDSLRPAHGEKIPEDNASRIEPAVDRAVGAGRPLVLFTDGEVDDPAVVSRLLAGSRVEVPAGGRVRDAAVIALDAPRSVVGGDTTDVIVRVGAGDAGAGSGSVAMTLDGALLVRMPVDSLAPGAERDVHARVRIPAEGAEHRVARAVLAIAGDGVPQNDSLGAALDVAAAPRAVFVSTSPDQDSRFALEVLRGTLAIAVRAFYRVAPGLWRQEPGFTPASETDVRKALADAPIAILHGDTALFGAPRSITSGALALLAPSAAGEQEEWYAANAPASPLSTVLGSIPFDSLGPISLGTSPRGDWIALTALRPRLAREDRAVIAGTERPRRVVVVAASGMWRWRFRGGASADAYAALWGGVFDWLAAGGDDRRAAIPAAAWSRASEPIAWRRGARRDSVVQLVLRRIGATRADTVMLSFPGSANVAESPPMAAGVYDVAVVGGGARLVVAPSREWLPRRATLAGGAVGTMSIGTRAPRLRDAWWAYVVVVAALCAEWTLRRRVGLR